MATGTNIDIPTVEAALAVHAALGVDKVEDVRRFPSGLSSHSYRIDVTVGGRAASWVLRREPEFGVIPPYDIASEARLLEAARAAGVPVPKVVHIEDDPAALGGRYMLMEFVDGATYRSQDPHLGSDPDLLTGIQDQFVEVLAQIHATRQDVLPSFADSAEAARAHVEACRRRMADTGLMAQPILTEALEVLDELAPSGAPLVLCHGDYRLPNLKWDGRRIVGVLDWELARVGDPMADLAFSQTVGAGPCAVLGEMAERYEELSGNTVDESRIVYHRVLEMVKGVIIGLAGAHDIVSGGDDLRLLSTAGLAATGIPVVAMLRKQLTSLEEARR